MIRAHRATRSAGRSGCCPTCRARSCGSAGWPRPCPYPGDRVRFDLDHAPGPRARTLAASGNPGGPGARARSCCSTTASFGSRSSPSRRNRPCPGRHRRPLSERKGVSVVGAVCRSGTDGQGPRRSRLRRATGRRLGRAVVRAAARGSRRGARARQGRAAVLAKIEKPAAVDSRCDRGPLDAVMVARGDLGVEMPPEQVPTIQRRILRACPRPANR